MSTSKQISSVKMGAYIYNGGYRPFAGYPIDFATWNVLYNDKPDFQGNPTTIALNGWQRGNPMGWRERISIFLDNLGSTNSTNVRQLLQLCSSQFDRIFFTTTAGAVTTTSVVINSGIATNDYYNGLYVQLDSSGVTFRITDYNSARVATVDGNPTGWTGNITVIAKANYPTIVGVSVGADTSTLRYCSLLDADYGINREFTVGKAVVKIELSQVERTQSISDDLRL